MFLWVPAHPHRPGQTAVKRLFAVDIHRTHTFYLRCGCYMCCVTDVQLICHLMNVVLLLMNISVIITVEFSQCKKA